MKGVRGTLWRVAPTSLPILLCGEPGVGKQAVARAIHESSRPQTPFVVVACTEAPDALLESPHDAWRGTLFLDEAAELSAILQARLFAILERQLGACRAASGSGAAGRIIAATRKDLRHEVSGGNFREDLFYRLSAASVTLPSLRERREDIPLLVESWIAELGSSREPRVRQIAHEAMKLLMTLPWPGNLAELQAVVEYAVISAPGETIGVEDLPREIRSGAPASAKRSDDLAGALRSFEKAYIENAFRRIGANRRGVAERLGIDLSTLYRKMQALQIRTEFPEGNDG